MKSPTFNILLDLTKQDVLEEKMSDYKLPSLRDVITFLDISLNDIKEETSMILKETNDVNLFSFLIDWYRQNHVQEEEIVHIIFLKLNTFY